MSSIVVAGDTSGSVTLQAPAVAGSTVLTLPTTSATLITDSSGILNIGSGQVYKDSSGNVGIGTSSPQAKEHIAVNTSAITETLRLDNIFNTGDNGNKITWYNAAQTPEAANISGFRIGATTGFGLSFSTSSNFATTAAAERMRIDSSGNVTLQNNISVGAAAPTTSGTGITFPATQSASTQANTLDDYEEGTWTPNQGAGLTVVGTFGSSGTYTKIGRLVTAIGAITPTTSVASSNGGVISTNLPFTSGSAAVGSVADANGNGGSVISQTAGTTILSYPSHTASAALWFTITYFI